MRPNSSFKPKLLRYTKGMAGKACHAFASTTQSGLTQALGGIGGFRGEGLLVPDTEVWLGLGSTHSLARLARLRCGFATSDIHILCLSTEHPPRGLLS